MNFIYYLIQMLLVSLFGAKKSDGPVYDLHKKPTREDHMNTINRWVQRNFYVICLVFLVILMITFIFVCISMCGVSAVESGSMRNFINGGYV